VSSKRPVSKAFCDRWNARSNTEAARKAIADVFPQLREAGAPVNLESAAKLVGIDQIVEADMPDSEGLLHQTASGNYVVSLRRGQATARRRFTLAHEISHVILYRTLGHLRETDESGCRRQSEVARDEERLCDEIAAELLMPRDLFDKSIQDVGVTAATVPAIARLYGVSLQAVSRRITQVLPDEIALSLWRKDEQRGHVAAQWYVSKSSSAKPEHAIELGSPGAGCFAGEPCRGWYWMPLHGQMDKFYVDVCPLEGFDSSKAWILLLVFSRAADHVMSTISRRR
jgi:Zn-dependent peptidase ImmA (M78 family)